MPISIACCGRFGGFARFLDRVLNINTMLSVLCLRHRSQVLLKPRTQNTFRYIINAIVQPRHWKSWVMLGCMSASSVYYILYAVSTQRELDVSRACAELLLPCQYFLSLVYFAHDHVAMFYLDAGRMHERHVKKLVRAADGREEGVVTVVRDVSADARDASVGGAGSCVSTPGVSQASIAVPVPAMPAQGSRARVEQRVGDILRVNCLCISPIQCVCAIVIVGTSVLFSFRVAAIAFTETRTRVPNWLAPFWVLTHTAGLATFLLNVCMFSFVFQRHVQVARLYTTELSRQKWRTVSDGWASLILCNLNSIKGSIHVSCTLFSYIFSCATFLNTLIAVTFYYSPETSKFTAENISGICLFGGMQIVFAMTIVRLSIVKGDIMDIVHSPSFSARFLAYRDPAMTGRSMNPAVWSLIRTILNDAWVEFYVLGLPLHNGTFIKQLVAGSSAFIAYANSLDFNV